LDNLYKTWLTWDQQLIVDRFTQKFENHSVLPESFWVSLVCKEILERMFLLPEEIEEIELGKDTLIPIDVLRKLYTFRYYFWNALDEIEKNLNEVEIGGVLKLLRISEIITIFSDASFISFKNHTRKFAIYFLAIEKWYEVERWYPLSFKWLQEPVWYDEWLWK